MLCTPGYARPKDREIARHPLVRVVAVEGAARVCSCPVCGQKFITSVKTPYK